MIKKLLTIIFTLAMAGTIGFFAFNSDTPMPAGNIIEENIIKPTEEMTWDEFNEYLEMVNYENKKLGGKLSIIKGEKIYEAWNRAILERPVTLKEKIADRNYKARREYLINKVNVSRK